MNSTSQGTMKIKEKYEPFRAVTGPGMHSISGNYGYYCSIEM